MSIISTLTRPWGLYAACAVAGVATLAAGVQTVRLAHEQSKTAQVEAQMAKQRADATKAALVETQRLRAIAATQAREQTEALNDAQKSIDIAKSDARTASRTADKLLIYASELAGRCAAKSSAAPSGASPAASAPGDLLAELLGRVNAAAGEIAEHADRARIAGLACERIHGAAVSAQ